MPKRNLAARAGYWSAKHRKIAIGGWLAFVVAAFILGGAIGTNTLADEDSGNGESRVADTAIHDANFPEKSDEQVLVQAREGKLNLADPAVKARVDDVVARLEKAKHVQDVKSPLAKGNEGQISEDGRSALVTFSLPDPRRAATRSSTPRSRPPRRRRRPTRTCGSSSSATPPPTRRSAPRSTTTSSARSSSRSRSRW